MYNTHRRDFFWPHMANYVQKAIVQWASCAQNKSRYRHKRRLQVFPASGPLDFVAMDILVPLPKIQQENQYIVVKTDRY